MINKTIANLFIRILAMLLIMSLLIVFVSCLEDDDDEYEVEDENWEIVSEGSYYVAPHGDNDNPGTEELPWRTIQRAASALEAGSTVLIKAGTYNERVRLKNSGSPGNYITFAAYPDDFVTIDGKGISLPSGEAGLIEIENLSYIRISGLKVINAGPNNNNGGIMLDGSSHIIIEKNYTYNTVSSGIGVWDCNNIIIDGNEVELACNDGEQECITIAGTDTFEVKNNYVHHGGPGTNGGEGIDLKDGSSNGKVYGNLVHHLNEKPGIYVDSWDKHTFNIEVYQNVVRDCGSGFSLASENGGLLENIKLYNNVSYNNEFNGFEIGNWGVGGVAKRPISDVLIINNTIYNNGMDWGGGIHNENPDAKNIIIRNNIVSQNLSFQIADEASLSAGNFVVDHNLIDGYRNYGGETYGSDYVKGNPVFMNTGNGDFHLKKNSPAIDNGFADKAPDSDFENKLRPQGAKYDIGAFEF